MKTSRNYLNTIESDISMSTIDLNNSAFINDNYPPDKLREKCLELVNLPYQPKYCDYVERIFKENNDKFIRKNAKDESFCEKLREVKEYAQGIRYIKKIKISDFKKIREMAISKGGFLTYDVRKILYKKIYLLNNHNVFNMLYIDYDSIINTLWDFDKTDIFSEKRIYEDIREGCDGRTIDADYRRSRILQLAQNEEDKKMAKLITLDLKKFLNLMCCLNNNIYNYYQGYHDLALFFILLYHKTPHYAVSVFQRFSEFNLKELLTCKYNKRKLINGVYDMIEMDDTLRILKFILDYIDPKVKIFFEEKELNEDINYYKKLKINITKGETQEENSIICHFALEWIITLFTRYFEDYNNIYRIFDYLMVSHSLAIYFLSAEIIIDYYYKLKNKNCLNDRAGQQEYYKNLKFDEINFDYYIKRCEKNLSKYLNDTKFKKMYQNLKLDKFYPIISEQSFVEKWVMVNNRQESSFINYVRVEWQLFKSFFIEDDFKSNKKKENKNENRININTNENRININTEENKNENEKNTNGNKNKK